MLFPNNNRRVLPTQKPSTEILFAQLHWNGPDAPGAPVTGISSPRKSVAELRTWHRPSKLIPARVGSLNIFPPAMCSFPITQYIDSGMDVPGILLPFSLIHVDNNAKKESPNLLMSYLHLILWKHASNYWSIAEVELSSAANSSSFTVKGGIEGIVANIWNILALIVLDAAAALNLHWSIQAQAVWGRKFSTDHIYFCYR